MHRADKISIVKNHNKKGPQGILNLHVSPGVNKIVVSAFYSAASLQRPVDVFYLMPIFHKAS